MVRRHPRARRLLLRLCPATRSIRLSVPPGLARARALAFIEQQMPWLVGQAARLAPPVPFEPGGRILFRGAWIDLVPASGGAPTLIGETLHVPGEQVRFEAAVRRWLRSEARGLVAGPVVPLARTIGREDVVVRVADPRARWGSCSSARRIMLSWRAVLAPDFVREALIAHEVAHLVELNHGPRFWTLAELLLGASHGPARRWLRDHGPLLHAHGIPRAGPAPVSYREQIM